MIKRLLSFMLITVLSLAFFAGCSSAYGEKTFDAEEFVSDCKLLAPASQYDETKLKSFEIDYVRAVFEKFGKSDFYKNMNDEEREAAFNALCNVLMTFSYGNAKTGFIEEYSIDMNKHKILCRLKDFPDSEVLWNMPGY